MAPNDVHEDDWVSVPDETQSVQAIKDLRAQLQTSQDMAHDFATRIYNLQWQFDELCEEVRRLQGVEDQAMSQRKKIKRVQKACDLLTEKVDAADKKAVNQEEMIQRLQKTNQDLAVKLSVVEKGIITQQQATCTLQTTYDDFAVKVATTEERILDQEQTIDRVQTGGGNHETVLAELLEMFNEKEKDINATKGTNEYLGTKLNSAEVEALRAEYGLHTVTHTR